jgi:tripartite-type tricarboxylate transporter receptor subunit TctC
MNKTGLVVAGLLAAVSVSWAAYPDRPIRLVAPFPPGGTVDTVARIVVQGLSDRLGQPIVIENKAGAATIVGADHVAKSPADGYTLLLRTATTFSVNPILYASLPYDQEASFTPIGFVGKTGLILLANEKEPASSLPELLDRIRAQSGQVFLWLAWHRHHGAFCR